MSEEQWPTWLFEYDHDGSTWGFQIQAPTADDAQARVRKLALYGRLCGELYATIPVTPKQVTPVMLLLRAFCWWRNK